MKPTDIRIREITTETEDFVYRSPIKFGGVAIDRVTLLNVHCVVETRSGKIGRGFGSMPWGNVWAFPSKKLTCEQTLDAMKIVSGRVHGIMQQYTEFSHPIDITHTLEPVFHRAAEEETKRLGLADPIPPLCTLVAASPFDAALHDAFGKAQGLNCFSTYGPEFMSFDLEHYLGREFKGEWLDQYVEKKAKPRMPLYHLVGALDPLTPADVAKPIGDGLPETLGDWIHFNGLTHLKIKQNGDDLNWDVERVLGVNAVAEVEQKKRGVANWHYSLDFNEKCENVEYLLQFLRSIKERSPAGFARIQYIEQPTKRDLKSDRANVMHEASKLRPVVIDESLLDQESLRLAREMGYTGAALKACKGQSQSLLMAAAAQKDKMFLCVQDLSCPGASLLHSASIAAHIPGIAAIEANSRQYCPKANEPWTPRFPGIFKIKDGSMETALLDGIGLGAVADVPV